MFIDFINVELKLNGQQFADHNLNPLSSNRYGWTTYTFGVEKDLKLRHHPEKDIIRICGSLPYFLRGHNLTSNIEDTKTAIKRISDLIELDISAAVIKCFEFGTVVTTKETPSSIFAKHLSLDDFFIRTYENGKYFVDPRLVIKLYDAKESFKRKANKKIKDELKNKGIYNPGLFYIKVEAKYKKPDLHFKRQLTLVDLIDSEFNDHLKEDLKHQFSRIKVIHDVIIPPNKSFTTLPYLLYYISKENEMLTGIPTKKRIKDLLDNIDPSNQSRQNKYVRMKGLDTLIKEVESFEKRTCSLLQ